MLDQQIDQLDIDDDELTVDSFAGSGGASEGMEDALGQEVDIAINHNEEALALHAANHPETRHLLDSVWRVDPVEACNGRPVALGWFSPDCRHFSKAKGAKPRDQKIRGLAWVAITWAARVRPRVIILENVEEFQTWGPLHRRGERAGYPIDARKGETFRAFVRKLERLGYAVEWRLLRACDYGAPTTRRRLFLVARCDGRPICWPEPTHGPGRSRPYRTAAEIIDWSIPCPSIFDRDKPLAEKTLARIARGIRMFVLDAARPFVAPMSKVGDHAQLEIPYLVHRSNGERRGQAPRIYDVQMPLGTIVAQGQKHALCTAFLAKHYGGNESRSGGSDLRRPIDTITAQDHHSLVTASLLKFYGTSTGSAMTEPVPTVTAGGWKLAQVAAFLVRYNGRSSAESLQLPLGTLTTRDRYGLVTVRIDGAEYVIADIGMRMLTPRELFRAQGFPDDYEIETGPNGRRLTKTAQVRLVGNSVCPPMAAAIVRAQFMPTRPTAPRQGVMSCAV